MQAKRLPKRLCPPSGWHRFLPIPAEQELCQENRRASLEAAVPAIFALFLQDNVAGMKICFKSELCINDPEMENGQHSLKEGVIITVDQRPPLFTTTPFVFRSN